ncbi:hypothetical protein [Dactylosporangium sp. NPDC005555]|uniref:hypothetical protein n=1 Tax=Dactylosporangium sp. NPDC005555 TaxID=3154889 RepID=UPI0033BFB193
MTERDPLRAHFDAFRDQSSDTAAPPPVEEIPRRLSRARRRRTAAAVLTAAALIALAALPAWGQGEPTPTPATPATAAIPSASSNQRPSGVLPPDSPICKISARGLPFLSDGHGEVIPSFDDAQTNVVPSIATLFDTCPSARLPFLHVTYGWDFEEDAYVLRYSDPFFLTYAEPTVPRPEPQRVQDSACGKIEALVATSHPLPLAIPREVQDSPGPNAATLAYLDAIAPTLPFTISVYSYSTVKSSKTCKPS